MNNSKSWPRPRVRLLKINDTPIARFTDIRKAIAASDGTLEVAYKIDLGGGREEMATIKLSDSGAFLEPVDVRNCHVGS